jgi:translation elongation factor EF-Tu-like GTPase
MCDVPRIIAELTFLTTEEGGRKHPPQPPWGDRGRWYLPHAVVEGRSEYLGVRFTDGPAVRAGETARFRLELMYTGVDYSALEPGVAITIREGGQIVARGRVMERV